MRRTRTREVAGVEFGMRESEGVQIGSGISEKGKLGVSVFVVLSGCATGCGRMQPIRDFMPTLNWGVFASHTNALPRRAKSESGTHSPAAILETTSIWLEAR